MKHSLFLFDLDDTLLDFKASEQLSFTRTMTALGLTEDTDALFAYYQVANSALWRSLEAGTVSKDFLKVERFRLAFAQAGLALDAEAASRLYLEALPETVVLIDGAQALCAALAQIGEVGIITNGVDQVQRRRIQAAGLADYFSFVATSEACGYAKPDTRFFDYSVKMARSFVAAQTIIVGDRLEADILGANRFGIASCWFNPGLLTNESAARPDYQVAHLDQIIPLLNT